VADSCEYGEEPSASGAMDLGLDLVMFYLR
jgi:hypothetical protein